MKLFKKIFLVAILLLASQQIISLAGNDEIVLEPFEFTIQDFPNVEVLDIEGNNEDSLSLLGKNKTIYIVDLDHKKVISKFLLDMSIKPTRFSYLSSGNFLIIDNINDNKSNIALFDRRTLTTTIIATLDIKINDIIYSDSFAKNLVLLTDENEFYSFSVGIDGNIEEMNSDSYNDIKTYLNRKFEVMTSLSNTITNDSSRSNNFSDIYGFVSQKEKLLFFAYQSAAVPVLSIGCPV